MENFDFMSLVKDNLVYQEKALYAAKQFMSVQNDEMLTDQQDKEVVFGIGKMKLYHYKPLLEDSEICKTPLLITYALVNRHYMLDLQENRSVIKAFLESGLDVYLIDWGYPAPEDKYMTVDDHVNWYMDECVEYIRKVSKCKKINLLGICQGGNFSVCYTALHQEKVNALVAMVSPIDFATNDSLLFRWGKSLDIDSVVDAFGNVPVDMLNLVFTIVKPYYSVAGKYIDLAQNPKVADKDFLTNFLRMEKWVFDGPAQEGETLRQFLNDLYRDNKLVKGEYVIGGKTVDLKKITCPVLNVCGSLDHLVPNNSSSALNDCISSKDKEFISYPVGHIGMYTGSKSAKEIMPNIASWLKEKSK